MTTSTKLDSATLALMVTVAQHYKPVGGSIDLHINNRGNPYSPKNPAYLVGGVVTGLAYTQAELENMDTDQFNDMLNRLAEMITEGEYRGGTVVGWWTDPITNIVSFDVSEEIDADVFSINLPLSLAKKREQLAIGLYLDGKYAHTINVI